MRALGHKASFFAGLAGALLALVGCGRESKADQDKAAAARRSVRVAPAARVSLPDVVAVSGTLGAEEQVVLGMKVGGRLSEIHVDLGSRPREGQALARLAPAEFELRVRQAEAALAQARARLGLAPGAGDVVVPEEAAVVRQAQAGLTEARARRDRARALFEEGVLPRADLDTAEASYQSAESQYQTAQEEVLNRQGVLAQRQSELDLARQQLADSVIVAPFDGAVRERHATPGEFVTAGQPVLTLVRIHPLRLRLAVPERSAARVRLGQEVRVHVDGDPRTYTGRVARLSPAIEESNRTLMVEAEVPNRDGALRPGAFAAAEILTSADQPAVLVPSSAIIRFAGIEKVLVVENEKTVEKRVRTGRHLEGRVEIAEGLSAGENVVVEPGNLVGGQEVRVTQ